MPYTRFGPYVLTELVEPLAYGDLHRAVKTQGLAYLDHLHLVRFKEGVLAAGLGNELERHRDWFEAFEGIRKIDHATTIEVDGERALVLPFARGRSLAALMMRNAEDRMVRLEHILTIAQDLVTLVANINAAGLVHGAISLETTWVDIDGHTRFLDAPLGKVLHGAGLQEKAMGVLAPHKRCLEPDFANDLESFGLILYHLISGSWPNRSSLEHSVGELSMVHDEWGDQETIPVPEVVKDLVLRSIQGGYRNGQDLATAFRQAYDHPSCEAYNATTFGVAFLLSTMIRLDLPGEQEALEIEKSYEFLEAVGEPKVVERERIVYQEDLRKKRRVIAIATVLAIAGLTGGTFALMRASRHRVEQQQIRAETEVLVAKYNREVAAFARQEQEMIARIEAAQSAGEKQALLAEFEKARQAHQAELATIRANIESLAKRQKELGGESSRIPPISAAPVPPVPGLPRPVTEAIPTGGQPAPAQSQAGVVAAQRPEPQSQGPIANQRERVRIPPESVPFTPSAKVPMNQGEAQPPPTQAEPVYLTGATKVETLKPAGLASTPGDVPTVAVRDQNTANQVRKLVIPQMDQSVLRGFEGQVVRVRVLVDPFGQVKSAAMDQCPPSLAADFKAAALRTQFHPIMENGRARQGWIALTFRVTGSGISFDGTGSR